jgi:hypothetical protein
MKKILVWVALIPVAIVIGIAAFSPKGAVVPNASAQVAAPTSSVTLKATPRPVMYELFTGW